MQNMETGGSSPVGERCPGAATFPDLTLGALFRFLFLLLLPPSPPGRGAVHLWQAPSGLSFQAASFQLTSV